MSPDTMDPDRMSPDRMEPRQGGGVSRDVVSGNAVSRNTHVPAPPGFHRGLREADAGQAAVEFVFALLGMILLLAFMTTMFLFSQDVFREFGRARADLLEEFHGQPQYEVARDTLYEEEVEAALRQLPFMGRFVAGVGPYRRNVYLMGGAQPPYTLSAALECAGAAALVFVMVSTDNEVFDVDGDVAGGGAALAACEALDALF